MQSNVEDVAVIVLQQFNSKLIGGKSESAASLITVVFHHTLLWLLNNNVSLVLKDNIPIISFQVVAIDENKVTEHVFNQFIVEGADGKQTIYCADLSLFHLNESTPDGLHVQLGNAVYSRAKKAAVEVASVDEWFLPNPTSISTPLHNSLEYIQKLHKKAASGQNIDTPIGPIPNQIVKAYYKFFACVVNHMHYQLFNSICSDFPKMKNI